MYMESLIALGCDVNVQLFFGATKDCQFGSLAYCLLNTNVIASHMSHEPRMLPHIESVCAKCLRFYMCYNDAKNGGPSAVSKSVSPRD